MSANAGSRHGGTRQDKAGRGGRGGTWRDEAGRGGSWRDVAGRGGHGGMRRDVVGRGGMRWVRHGGQLVCAPGPVFLTKLQARSPVLPPHPHPWSLEPLLPPRREEMSPNFEGSPGWHPSF